MTVSNGEMTDSDGDFVVIDSHIHLYTREHIQDLAWSTDLPQDHVLNRPNSVDQWLAATSKCSAKLRGFVFVETDRKSGLNDADWLHPLEEINFLARISSGNSQECEAYASNNSNLVLGIVPWAPIAAGRLLVNQYLDKAIDAAGSEEVWNRVRGFRYLLQDKPKGTAVHPSFLQGLLALEERGTHSFDLGVDARSRGLWQLQEACLMLENFYSACNGRMNIIVNHMCKPNLHLTPTETHAGALDYEGWKDAMKTLAGFPSTYMKLSGLFSELPHQSELHPTPIADLLKQTKPWMDVIFTEFGPSRILFASDWPVCNVGGPGITKSWQYWYDFVKAVLEDRELTEQEKRNVWSGTAAQAYGLDIETAR